MRGISGSGYKYLILLASAAIFIAPAASLSFSNPSNATVDSSEFMLNVSNSTVMEGTDYEVGYWYNDTGNQTIGNSSDLGNEFGVKWSSAPSSDGTYPVWAKFTNGNGSEFYKTARIFLTWDTTDPSSTYNNENTTFSDGNVQITWDGNDNNDLSEFILWRNTSSAWTQASSTSASGDTSTTKSLNHSTNSYSTFEYKLEVVDSAGNRKNASTTVGPIHNDDGENPYIDSRSPGKGEHISDDSPTVEVTGKDDVSGISNVSMEVNGEWATDSSNPSVDLSGLDDSTYTVKVNLTDSAGNKNEGVSWDFTVDTTKPDPSVSLKPDQDNLKSDTDIEISVGDTADVDEVTCYVGDPGDGGESFGSDGSADSDDDYDCGELDISEYEQGEHEIWAEICDKADNCRDKKAGSYVFDTEDPAIESLSAIPGYTNVAPKIEVEASDSGSGVEAAEYGFSSFDDGEGTNATVVGGGSDVTFSFKPNISGKDKGDYTVYVKVRDGSDRWSSQKSVDFTYDPSATPSVELVHGPVKVETNSSADYNVTVNNTGDVGVVSGRLFVVGKAAGKSAGFDLEGGNSEELEFEVSSSAPFGTYTGDLRLNSSSIDETSSVEIQVKADNGTRQELDSLVEEHERKLELLKQNVSRLKNNGLGGKLAERLEKNVSRYEQMVEAASSAAEDGEYYRAASELRSLDTESSDAFNALETVEEKHSSNVFLRNIIVAVAVVVLVIAGIGVFFWRSDEYALNVSRVYSSDLGVSSIRDVDNRIRSLFRDEEEAEEFEWDGFE